MKTAADFYWVSTYYAVQGDKEKALAALQHSLRLGYRDLQAIHSNRAFYSLQGDPRFSKLLLRFFCK